MGDRYNQKWVLRVFAPKGETEYAVTIGQTTYYSVSKEEVDLWPPWRLHENQHKKQWKELGWIRFIFMYSYYHFRYGYWLNPLEVDARKAAGNG